MHKFRFTAERVIHNQKRFTETYCDVMVRTKLSFALTRLMLICLHGSRLIKSSAMAINDTDMQENLPKIKGNIN